ncbi:hypothetical protein FIBSPDRAFT_288471 [Athelia psychrophila]|uniref:Uncharacterized protein n=1 Tax=Athelia psychrophila TaxID=1759441 RepID=A0A167XLB3_9AGAM|nr:hypothetical protein FIBSPDRAFT_288471 [Fibularhizoctonia sp. CBS 109695]
MPQLCTHALPRTPNQQACRPPARATQHLCACSSNQVHAPATRASRPPHIIPRVENRRARVCSAFPSEPRTRAAPMRGCHHPRLLPQRTRRERSMSHASDAAKPRDGSLTATLPEKKAVPVILCIIIGDACSCTVSWHRRGPYALLSTGDHGVQSGTSSTTQ